MAKGNDWEDELGSNKRQRKRRRQNKQPRKKNSSEQGMDEDYAKSEQDHFLSNLEAKSGAFNWMKEDRHKRMFRDIESKIQGALGKGTYDWVDRRVFDQVFDRMTLMSLYKLMKAGTIDTLDFPIARGKEAHVFHATDIDGKVVAVKIFHTSNAVFKNLIQYIEGDRRFGGLRRRHRDLVDIWVRKEHRNLSRLFRWGLNVPRPLGIHKNVLVMEYVGTNVSASPKLREVKVDAPEDVFQDLLEFLAISWQKAKLVHGDFSPYNILWHDGRAMVIDVGQAVIQTHPKAQEFLVRDVTRLVEWGKKNGIKMELAEAMFEVLNMNLDHVQQQMFSEEE
ncbi:MAG: serine protein kinase RIO [Euryarchaeota archaeon]|jgi:RIO kinase 1|nr:serine protein kinase RIO [Euryarchaeota archaeon]MBT5026007.1 serine protein kinase RIO [Euryarchaeota archaeon]MBT6256146.1 serine protein kinase RIO [Euryarchaeota archaeon]MBT6527072.1 serine protein kinase RIO [Euryarchaeota archaeon]